MNRALVAAAAAFAVVLAFDPSANADVRKRWSLDFEHDKPNTFTYRYKNGRSTNVWYMTYHVKNNSEMEAPLIFDLFARTDRGKMVHQGWYPHIVARIAQKLEGLGPLDSAALDAAIEKLNGDKKYLDMSKIRQKGVLAPGEEFWGIVLFEGVPWGWKQLEILVTSLTDAVRFKEHKVGESEAESKIKYEYESRTLRIVYTGVGNQFYAQFDPIDFLKRDYVSISLGAIGDRKTLDLLVEALSLDDEIARRSANDLLEKLTDQKYNYDGSKTPAENDEAIRNWRSWVNQNKYNLVWDESNLKFIQKNPQPK